jgi:hypothetical protein
MSQEERTPYITAYECDRRRYLEDQANLTSDQRRCLRAIKRMKKQRRRASESSIVLSSYMRFGMDHRRRVVEANPGASFQEIGRKLGAEWRGLDPGIKKTYLQAAAEARHRLREAVSPVP